MTTETTDFADFTEIFSFCHRLCRWFCCWFFVLFFFSFSSQSVIWFRLLFLLLMFVFCVSVFFSPAPLSYSSSYILSELLPLTKNNAFTFRGGVIIVLLHQGGFLKSKPLSFCCNPVFVFRTKLSHRNRFQAVVFAVDVCVLCFGFFFLLRLSVIHLVIFCLNFFH